VVARNERTRARPSLAATMAAEERADGQRGAAIETLLMRVGRRLKGNDDTEGRGKKKCSMLLKSSLIQRGKAF